MARRKNRRDTTSDRPSRGLVTGPSRSLDDRHALRRVKAPDLPIFSKPKKPKPKSVTDFRPVEDLRHVPDQIDKRQMFRLRDGRPARQVRKPENPVRRPRLSVPMHDYFADPARTLVCVRRHERKRVLFALRKAGKGKRVSRERNFTDKSFVRCK